VGHVAALELLKVGLNWDCGGFRRGTSLSGGELVEVNSVFEIVVDKS
jgi:hypothetical protein